jgi:diadenosine tetraphosphatase ApaH/serine/threonine PP2A family protein phosphatase
MYHAAAAKRGPLLMGDDMDRMQRLYAIGDIHGSLDKLRSLLARCEHDCAGRPARFVFVGDYIDRGPESRGVVEYLRQLQSRLGDNAVCLKGNHEVIATAAFEDSAHDLVWLANGGEATLQSYGVESGRELPADHVAWLRSLPLTFDDGQRLFVHAGVDPRKPLERQDEQDLLWIRQPFLSDLRDYGRLIVHGHTPVRTGIPELRVNRVNIDTGAVFGGPLTAAVFVPDRREPIDFLQAAG